MKDCARSLECTQGVPAHADAGWCRGTAKKSERRGQGKGEGEGKDEGEEKRKREGDEKEKGNKGKGEGKRGTRKRNRKGKDKEKGEKRKNGLTRSKGRGQRQGEEGGKNTRDQWVSPDARIYWDFQELMPSLLLFLMAIGLARRSGGNWLCNGWTNTWHLSEISWICSTIYVCCYSVPVSAT